MRALFVSTERVSRAGSEVVEVATRLDQEIAGVEATLAQIRAGWSSDRAAPRFAGVLLEYLAQARELKTALVGQGQALTRTGQVFDEAEDDVAATFGGR